MTSVSVIGLGLMGTAIAQALLDKGIGITVWNRSTAKADNLAARGAKQAPTALDAINASPLVLICLTTQDAVREILEAEHKALLGRSVVNLTSGTPAQARALATWTAEQGAQYLSAAILAIPPMIGKPGAIVLYSGEQPVLARHIAVLECLALPHYLGDDLGRSVLFDIALLTGMYGLFAGGLQALALMRAEKIPAKEILLLLIPWLQAMMGSLPRFAEKVDARDYSKPVSRLGMQAEGFHHMIEAYETLGVSPELVVPLHRLMKRGVAGGYGDEDFVSLVELLLQKH